ncbi:MAG: tetratricopeptide repeat protein [Terriglobia bacterium]
MKKPTIVLALLSLPLLLSVDSTAGHVVRSAPLLNVSAIGRMQASPQAARSPQWQSRQEYDAFNAMTVQGRSPEAQIASAEAFLQRFPGSDFKFGAYLREMQCYQLLGKVGPSIDAARKVLRLDRDNLEALSYLSYIFPFTFRAESGSAGAALTLADNDARHGLGALQRLERPPSIPPDQFQREAKSKRAVFNNTLGFVALQRNDYPRAITALNAAVADNPSEYFAFYRLGVAYLFSTPADYDHGIWYLARAAGLARTSKDPSGQGISRYLRKVFVQTLGSDAAMEDTISQAVASVNPPDRMDRPDAPRGEIGAAQDGSASASHKPNPSGSLATGQSSSVTINRVYAPIYPAWLPPSENESEDQAPPPPPAELGDQIAAQLYNLAGEMSTAGQELPVPHERASPPEPPEPEPALPETVLVYKDGRQVEVQNYAIMGENLVWFSGQLSKKIPLADLDLSATRKVNEDHGITFGAPGAP